MSKGKGMRGGAPGVPMPRMSGGGAQDLLASFQQKMTETQEALANENVEVSVGGGAVTVVMSGKQQMQSVKISPDAVSAGDVEMLQDLVVAAVNEAIEKSQELAAKRMSAITGGMGLGNLGGLLG